MEAVQLRNELELLKIAQKHDLEKVRLERNSAGKLAQDLLGV